MSLKSLLNVAAVATLAAAVAAPGTAGAQTAPAARAKTEAQAAQVSGKLTTDAPTASQVQGTAWAAKQASANAAAAAAPAGPSAQAVPRVVARGDLVETMRTSGQFTNFLKALDATNLTGLVKNNPNLTVFAPTDAAFAPGQLDQLMADKGQLQKLLTHHVINARVDSSKIKGAKGPVPSVAGNPIELDGSGDVLKADNATIVQSDVMATNGVLQVVDGLLTPGASAAPASASAAPAAATTSAPATASKKSGGS